MKTILFIRRTYGFGGTEGRLLDWLERVDYAKNRAYVLSPTDVFSEKMTARGIQAQFLSLSQAENNKLFGQYDPVTGRESLSKSGFWAPFLAWWRFISRIRPDSVVMMAGHLFSYPVPCVLAAFLASRGRVYLTVHSMGRLEELPRKHSGVHLGFLPGLGWWWYTQVWPKTWSPRIEAGMCRRVLAASQTIRNRIVTSYKLPSQKMDIITHGADTHRFCPSLIRKVEWRRSHNIPENELVIVSTGRLSGEKGALRLLRAFDLFAKGRANVRLVLAGDGPLREEVKKRAAVHLADGKIILLGHLEDVAPVLQASDIYVLPSDSEGCAIALLEAMATGLVCVSTMVGGPREIISDRETGFLIEPTDEGVLHGLQEASKLSPADRAEIGRKARRVIESKAELRSAVSHAFRLLDIEGSPDTAQPMSSHWDSDRETASSADAERILEMSHVAGQDS